MDSELPSINFPYLLCFLVACPFLVHFLRLHASRQYAAPIGYQSPFYFPSGRLPFGISFLLLTIKGFKTHTHLPLMHSRFLVAKRKTYAFTILGTTAITTMDAENFREILGSGFENWGFGELRRGNFGSSFGETGILVVDGDAWSALRGVLKCVFRMRREVVMEMMENNWEKAWKRLAAKIDLEGEKVVDLQPLFFRASLEISLWFLYGVDVDSLCMSEEELCRFEWAFNGVQIHLAKRSRFGKFYWLGGGKEFGEMIGVIHKFADKVIRQCLDREENKDNFLLSLPPSERRYHVLSLLLAARDSTAVTLSFLLTHLAHNLAIFSTLQTQIRDLYGTTLSSFLSVIRKKGPDYIESHPQLLNHCINETLRVHPPVPLNQRFAARDCTLPHGGGSDGTSPIFIEKGQRVDLNFWALHHDSDVWGSDSDVWKPERWAEMEKGERRKPEMWQFAPFSGGKRNCMGRGMAMKEIAFLVVRFCQEVERVEAEEEERNRYESEGVRAGSYLAMYVAGGAKVRCWGRGRQKLA
ncbi:cytochrome P450 [Ascobolus immersus RN42]|uniref:Cytochrome P450 n=1 Tax=Ascobolus immersus RN42 TaxID=1160509 RepID=A0A3N4HHQ1_ASCIM|nr:cytochrome P450 [Ascobolus immersus RN42]